jgi:hypothetical protein
LDDPVPSVLGFSYTFAFDDGATRSFAIQLDHATLAVTEAPTGPLPEWTRLSFRQCPNCPLREEQNPRCPIAANLVEVVEFLRDRSSFEPVEVRVVGEDREYRKRTTLQQGAGSLMGIYMVSSGCPVMDKLRPMVDTHLPFMKPDESCYRMISMYLTAQYFRARAGQEADWDLDGFLGFLRACHETNAGFCNRLRAIGVKDASLNALATLSAMGEITSLTIETEDLERWRRIFLAHYGG